MWWIFAGGNLYKLIIKALDYSRKKCGENVVVEGEKMK